MAFTDNCDVFASFHEDGFNAIIQHVRLQRPSLFNYGSPGVIANHGLLCERIKAHPVVKERNNPYLTEIDPLAIPGTSHALEMVLQVTKIDLDFHPGNRFELPRELRPLPEQRLAIRMGVCLGLGCPRDLNVDDYIDPPVDDPEEKREKDRDENNENPKPIPVRRMQCVCLEVFAVGGVKIKSYNDKPYLEPFLDRIEIVDIRPQELEDTLECFIELTLKLGVLPGLRILLERAPLEIIKDVASLVVKPTPTSSNVPNNPAIEDHLLKAFIDLEVV